MAMRISLIVLGLISLGMGIPPLWAAQKDSSSSKRQGPLKHLPSKPGAHIAKVKALKDDTWLNLGTPTPDPKWGKARCSAWGANALVFAPDLRGAFVYGEGVHAFVKPDGYGMDDLWFYDINAHTWICLHPGVNTKNFTQQITVGQTADRHPERHDQQQQRRQRQEDTHRTPRWRWIGCAIGHAWIRPWRLSPTSPGRSNQPSRDGSLWPSRQRCEELNCWAAGRAGR